MDEYTAHINFNPLRLDNSWFTITDIGGMTKEHDHPNSIISGSFYINVDEDSSPITFQNPNFSSFCLSSVVDDLSAIRSGKRPNFLSPYTYRDYTFLPEKGDLILFPSWVRHGSSYVPNQTVDRTIISFNTHAVIK